MAPAAAAARRGIGGRVDFAPPRFPVWANATAAPYGDDVGAMLLAQLDRPGSLRRDPGGHGRRRHRPGSCTSGRAT